MPRCSERLCGLSRALLAVVALPKVAGRPARALAGWVVPSHRAHSAGRITSQAGTGVASHAGLGYLFSWPLFLNHCCVNEASQCTLEPSSHVAGTLQPSVICMGVQSSPCGPAEARAAKRGVASAQTPLPDLSTSLRPSLSTLANLYFSGGRVHTCPSVEARGQPVGVGLLLHWGSN